MKGGFDEVEAGCESESDRSVGASSSWKAFSTERRQKKVVIVLKELARGSWTLRERLEFAITGGSVSSPARGESDSVCKR